MKPTGSAALYTFAAERGSAAVIRSYSTSFGWATKLLAPNIRHHVANIYGLVRVADEIVDGAASESIGPRAGFDPHQILDQFERDTYRAIEMGFSSNLIIHAFAQTAREVGIGRDLIQPFFISMRMDLRPRTFDQRDFKNYVYGSAEVVGLMCLQVFLKDEELTLEERDSFIASARALGAAFQKVNFLRDLAADFNKLGRSYFPGLRPTEFTDAQRDVLVADINADIELAKRMIPALPANSQRAVVAALALFSALNKKIASTPAARMMTERIRVPDYQKLVIWLKAFAGIKLS